MDSSHAASTKPIYRSTQIVWYIFFVVETLLVLRFGLKLLAANPTASFSSFIYTATDWLVSPFLFVFQTSRLEGSVVEWGTILAMAVYAMIAYGVTSLLLMSTSVSTSEAARRLKEVEY